MARKRNNQYGWVHSPSSGPKPKVPESLKTQVQEKAQKLVEEVLKPQHIQEPPKDAEFNYLTDIFTKWYRNCFYFCSTYACPGPGAISPSFEARFARMEYVGDGKFNLAYMRHTEQWWEIFTDLSLEETLEMIRDDPHFQP